MAEEEDLRVTEIEMNIYPVGAAGERIDIQLSGDSQESVIVLKFSKVAGDGQVMASVYAGNIPGDTYAECRGLVEQYFQLGAELMADAALSAPVVEEIP